MQVLNDSRISNLSILISKFKKDGYPDVSFENKGSKNNVDPFRKTLNLRFKYLKELAKYRKIQNSVSWLQSTEVNLNKLSKVLDNLKNVDFELMKDKSSIFHNRSTIFQSLYSIYKDMSKLSKDFPSLNSLVKSVEELNVSIASSYKPFIRSIDLSNKIYRVSSNIDNVKHYLKNNLSQEISEQLVSTMNESSASEVLDSIKSTGVPEITHKNLDSNSAILLLS